MSRYGCKVEKSDRSVRGPRLGGLGENFGDLTWSSAITASYLEGELGEGAVRVCSFPPNVFAKEGQVRERLMRFDRNQKAFAYEARPGGILERAVNRWAATPLASRRSRVSMHATADLKGLLRLFAPLIRPMLMHMGKRTLDKLAKHVATLKGG